ncbi:class F sortase [Kitasatospora purpeofusca]|uniref:class F sortase n=1 Tax=Kitasatospora purpeofusca TaxID=67352 RepID=UPI00225942AE|nr:class F sortase [Kitasatospora purpeofusca]MCX4756319.1 class F sortase [Kitasatospora purpeofusca]WSR35854.1 class F sortase [Kitasatospora purpeofusca]WSR44163.1 class F sortase [Kitasatospora purpeofusca]
MAGLIPGTSRLLRAGMGAAAVGLLLIYNSVDSVPADDAAAAAAAPPAAAASAAPGPATGAATDPAAPAPGAPAGAAGAAPAAPVKAAAPLKRSKPTGLRIPQLNVDAPFTELTLSPAGQLNAPPPDDKNLVGWYRDGVTPGERGAAVVAGHVDTTKGPAVFLLLSLMLPGNKVEVRRADGTVAVFSVDAVETFAKDAFPDQKVYGKTPDAQLRLITCGGTYDKKRRDYLDNVVVFAHLESSRKA